MDAAPLRIAVTGHRPKDLFGYDMQHPGWQWLRGELQRVVEEISARGPVQCVSGMAIGVDQVFAEVALESAWPLVAYVPFPGQESRWPPQARVHYNHLLRRASMVYVVCGAPSLDAFFVRNQAMVDAADVVVTVWTGKASGGTHDCLQAALRAGRPVVWIDPVARRVVDVGLR